MRTRIWKLWEDGGWGWEHFWDFTTFFQWIFNHSISNPQFIDPSSTSWSLWSCYIAMLTKRHGGTLTATWWVFSSKFDSYKWDLLQQLLKLPFNTPKRSTQDTSPKISPKVPTPSTTNIVELRKMSCLWAL